MFYEKRHWAKNFVGTPNHLIKKPKIDDENLRKSLAQMTNASDELTIYSTVSLAIKKSIGDIPNRNKFWNEETEGDKIAIRMIE
ncbi:unnamed protein product [Brugia pahangi]|uniref:Uncharacterized protein n=1 Tax=Brugia pahangi TaxID=6280 RepID=A0A0N4T0H8_BRUPA|nr:unnamed protein product [Brugia pahangi]